MICDPHWSNFLSSLLLPVLTVLGVYIAYMQWKINRNKLKLDLFEKRLAIYQETTSFLSSIVITGQVPEEKLWKFTHGTRETRWLLSEEISAYMKREIREKAIDLQILNDELKNLPEGPDRSENVHNQREIKNWIEQQFEVVDNYFKPFLKLSH